MNSTPFSPTPVNSFYSSNMLAGASRRDPKQVAGLFEALFFRSMLQQARDTQEEDPLFGSFQMSQVQGMFDDELANHMGMMGQLGIADRVMENIRHKEGPASGLLKEPTPRSKENG